MSNNLVMALIICLVLGCCTSRIPKNSGGSATGQDASHRMIQKPNVIKQNVTIVECQIDSVVLGDNENFQLFITILSASVEEDIDSYADVGQKMIVTPEYFHGETGIVDGKNLRNENLIALWRVKEGDIVRAKVSLGNKGEWKIIEVLN